MKTQTISASLKLASGVASIIAVLGVAGCASDHPSGSQVASVPLDDHAIVWQVRDSYKTNPDYPYAGVTVTATNGDVQLAGYVQTVWQKYNAAALAARVPGVKVVANHIIALNDNAPTTASSGARE